MSHTGTRQAHRASCTEKPNSARCFPTGPCLNAMREPESPTRWPSNSFVFLRSPPRVEHNTHQPHTKCIWTAARHAVRFHRHPAVCTHPQALRVATAAAAVCDTRPPRRSEPGGDAKGMPDAL